MPRTPTHTSTGPEPQGQWHDVEVMLDALREDALAHRWSWGVPALDVAMRGLRAGRFHIIAGAPHGGKTSLAIQMVNANPTAKIIWVSPDEGAAYGLQKILAHKLGVDEGVVEDLLRDDLDVTIKQTAQSIVDHVYLSDARSMHEITAACVAAERYWGVKPDIVVFDYVDQLQGHFGAKERIDAMKLWADTNNVAFIALHQSNRNGMNKQAIPSLEYLREAGPDQAFTATWVKRPYVDPDSAYDLISEQNQASSELWVIKAKGGGRTSLTAIKVAIEPGAQLIEWTDEHTRKAEGKT